NREIDDYFARWNVLDGGGHHAVVVYVQPVIDRVDVIAAGKIVQTVDVDLIVRLAVGVHLVEQHRPPAGGIHGRHLLARGLDDV
ncbi:hypothetical protein PMAYCL1PPCAC_03930, partial [Pristionchus mayeri]